MGSQLPTADRIVRSGHALVLGSSMAGLLAARVLAEHFERVTIVERDQLPDAPEFRSGVPQARHAHVLLMRGRVILEQLFPGICRELVSAGGLEFDMTRDLAWLTPEGWGATFSSGILAVSASRALLEWSVRQRLLRRPEVRILDGVVARGLVPTSDRTGVAGVRLFSNREDRFAVDLVVDASGRGSRLPEWLSWLGYPAPRETTIDASLGYASRIYRRPRNPGSWWKCVFVQAAPPDHPKGGGLFPIEGDRWLVSLFGGGGHYPPTDESGFHEFARSLRTPLIAGLIADAEPLSPLVGTRATANRLRHYDELTEIPDGVVALGDAVCAFNPVYAQGMTVAAIGAETLNRCLTEHRGRNGATLEGFARYFQRQLARAIATPWQLATAEDYRYIGVKGPPAHWSVRLMHRYVDRVVALSTEQIDVRARLMRVLGLMAPPSLLFGPGIAGPVLRRAVA
jgi:2-polyprenyl-6-methoxyphenol hydroxylase-like FAD-dependent oxidoreductase